MDQAPLDLFNPQAQDAGSLGVLCPSQAELPDLLQGWSGPRPLRVLQWWDQLNGSSS